MVDTISEWIRMCQHQLQLRSLSLSHNILTQPLLISTRQFAKHWKSTTIILLCAILCNATLIYFVFNLAERGTVKVPKLNTLYFVMVSVFSWEETRRYFVASFTPSQPQHTAQNVTEPVPTRHATHRTRYLPLSYPQISTPLLLKIRYFWYFHKQRITVAQMLSFLNWIFLFTPQNWICVRPALGSLCWLDMRRLLNRAEQGFSISTERNKLQSFRESVRVHSTQPTQLHDAFEPAGGTALQMLCLKIFHFLQKKRIELIRRVL